MTRVRTLGRAFVLTIALIPNCLEAQVLIGGIAEVNEVLEWLDPLFLEETAEAYNARPRLSIDPAGGFLVSDDMAAQVRVYDANGSLREYFGRDGDGPGEFRRLRGVTRLPSGQLCTIDFEGRLAVWSPTGELAYDLRIPIRGAMGVAALGGSTVAVVMSPVVAWQDSLDVPWVRVVDVETRVVGEEVLSLPLTAQNVVTASSVEGDISPTLGSRFGLTWTVFDSLWVVDFNQASRTEVLHLESTLLGRNTRWVDRTIDREGFVEWMLEATFPGAVFPAPDGGWLVSLFSRRPRASPSWGLLRVDYRGRRIWEVEEAPRLVAIDPSGVLYFEDPTGLEPNRFERARLRD